jgi:hypothetical protein
MAERSVQLGVGDGPQEEPAQWVVSVNSSVGLNVLKRVFYRAKVIPPATGSPALPFASVWLR